MSNLKCKNCQASIPPQSLKCDYCDTEVSIVDSAKNISAEGIAQTGKRLSNRVRPFLKKLGGEVFNNLCFFLLHWNDFFGCLYNFSRARSISFQYDRCGILRVYNSYYIGPLVFSKQKN